MAKKKVIDELANHWMEEIKGGLDYRKKYSTRDRWDDFRKYYRGQWAEGLTPVNKIFSYGRMMIPKVYFRAPRITVTPTRPDMAYHAKVVEAIDNTLVRETFLKDTLKRASLDTYLCGVGPIKLGYDSQYGYIPEQAAGEDGATVTQISKKSGEKIEYEAGIQPGMPWALRARPEDVVVPWGTSDPNSLPWVAHYILRPLDDIKQDQKYRPEALAMLQGTRTPALEENKKVEFRSRHQRDKVTLFAEMWEIRDIKTKQIIVLCEDQVLMATNDVLQIDNQMPWEFLTFNPDPEYFWGISDVHILEPQQKELNDTKTQASHHRRVALLKFLYKEGALSKEELDKFLSGAVGVAISIKDVDNLAAAIMMVQPHIPPDLAAAAAQTIQDMREELGFSQNQEGAFSPYHGKTATETMTVAQSFEDRVDERKDIVGDTIVSIMRKWNKMIFSFWTETKVIQIVSPEGEPFWVEYTGAQIDGEYYLNLDVESGMPISRPLKYQMGKELFETYGGDELINQVLLRQISLDSYSLVDPRVANLLQVQPGMPPAIVQATAAGRQPGPGAKGGGGGKGSAGGRQGSSPARPMEFEQAKQRFMGRK